MSTFKTTEELAGASELLKRNVTALLDQSFILKVDFDEFDNDPDHTMVTIFLDKNPNPIVE